MLIQAVFADKRIGLISHTELDQLIESGSIAAFRRKDSWAFVGKDLVRHGNRHYSGEERRGQRE